MEISYCFNVDGQLALCAFLSLKALTICVIVITGALTKFELFDINKRLFNQFLSLNCSGRWLSWPLASSLIVIEHLIGKLFKLLLLIKVGRTKSGSIYYNCFRLQEWLFWCYVFEHIFVFNYSAINSNCKLNSSTNS